MGRADGATYNITEEIVNAFSTFDAAGPEGATGFISQEELRMARLVVDTFGTGVAPRIPCLLESHRTRTGPALCPPSSLARVVNAGGHKFGRNSD